MNGQMSNADLVSLTPIKRALKHPAALSVFFRSAGYRRATAHLKEQGYAEHEFVKRTLPYPGSPAEAMVHKLIAVEYLRWASYEAFAKRVLRDIA